KFIYHFIQDRLTSPDFVVDISPYWERKMASIFAYRTQFYSKDLGGIETYISSPLYLKYIEARSTTFGHMIGVAYGEGFTSERMIGVNNIFDLI
ncbi:MAG: bacillithiol biosynthesis deacetylase BshB1, partial [Cytophagales bacterium]|nr:bacillithiol biosynthesis deacetylase BshB1 [Cytophagales bacterium]